MRDRAERLKTTSGPAVTRRRSAGVTLACAAAVAVVLGAAVGIWVNARLAPASSARVPRPARPLPDARAPAPAAPAARPTPCDGCATASVVEAIPVRGTAGRSDESGRAEVAGPKTDSVAPKGGTRVAAPESGAGPNRPDGVAAAGAEAHGVTNSEAVAAASPAASPDPSRPVAWEVSPLPKAGVRAVARVNVERGAARLGQRSEDSGARAQPEPCAPYASANSLSIRVGGAAPLVLGGPGVGVRINVSTPDRSELEIIYEGPAGGDRGWLRYSVRSIGGRPGHYKVRFSTPCGSQTIPVTVVRQ